MVQKINPDIKKRIIQDKYINLVLSMLHIVPRHYAELQKELRLSRSKLDKTLAFLEEEGLVNILEVDIIELPSERDILKRSYPRHERNFFSFLNPLTVSPKDYPSGNIPFYFITKKALRYLDAARKSFNHRR